MAGMAGSDTLKPKGPISRSIAAVGARVADREA
jgi:hypothetical protein